MEFIVCNSARAADTTSTTVEIEPSAMTALRVSPKPTSTCWLSIFRVENPVLLNVML